MNDPLKKYIDNNREAFDNKMPSGELWSKIQANIPQENKIEEAPKRSITRYWSIAASALVVVSAGLYFMLNQPTDNVKNGKINQEIVQQSVLPKTKELKTEKIVPTKSEEEVSTSKMIVSTKNNQVEKKAQNNVTIEKSNIKASKSIFLNALNDEESTSNRIDAIAKLSEYETLDRNDLELLKQKALHDNNTIVRLNAIEILAKKTPQETVSEELTQVFLQQDDPMVQMELIAIIGKMDNNKMVPQLTKKLQEMVLDPQTKPFVKDEAYAVLLKK